MVMVRIEKNRKCLLRQERGEAGPALRVQQWCEVREAIFGVSIVVRHWLDRTDRLGLHAPPLMCLR